MGHVGRIGVCINPPRAPHSPHPPGHDMGEAVAFYTLSVLILGFAVLVVSARHTVHSVLFLARGA